MQITEKTVKSVLFWAVVSTVPDGHTSFKIKTFSRHSDSIFSSGSIYGTEVVAVPHSRVELVVDAGEHLRDGGGITDHTNSAHNLGQVTARNNGRRLVVNTALEARRTPVDLVQKVSHIRKQTKNDLSTISMTR